MSGAMNFSERLRAAREHSGLTQDQLAEKSGVKQGTISKIERGDSDSSTFTVELAVACGVRPEWLAMEQGEMIDGLYVHDEKLKRALVLLQELPDYAVDQAVKDIDSIAQLVKKASGSNG